jgi:hypothetical protein
MLIKWAKISDSISKIAQLFGILIAFAMAQFFAQTRLPSLIRTSPQNESGEIFIGNSRFSNLTAGFGGFFSSAIWVNTIFKYAGVLFDQDAPGPVVTGFTLSSNLDTLWAHSRLVAAWAVPQLKGYNSRDALPFLSDGANRFPREWQFRLTWAQYVLDANDLESTIARDSASKILLPLSTVNAKVPQYARNLAFTLLHKNGRPEEAMSLLLQTYEQVPDPMVRLQFRDKIGDLLQRNHVPLGADSADFLGGIGTLLESKDGADHAMAGRILTGLVDTAHREVALVPARQLAGQFRSYRAAAVK